MDAVLLYKFFRQTDAAIGNNGDLGHDSSSPARVYNRNPLPGN
jgi:hypothetical protein